MRTEEQKQKNPLGGKVIEAGCKDKTCKNYYDPCRCFGDGDSVCPLFPCEENRKKGRCVNDS